MVVMMAKGINVDGTLVGWTKIVIFQSSISGSKRANERVTTPEHQNRSERVAHVSGAKQVDVLCVSTLVTHQQGGISRNFSIIIIRSFCSVLVC